MVLLCPSEEFIAALPYGKIPDRSDFIKLSTEERQAYWRVVAQASEQLNEELAGFCEQQDLSWVQPIEAQTD